MYEWFCLLDRLKPELRANGLNESAIDEALMFVVELWNADER